MRLARIPALRRLYAPHGLKAASMSSIAHFEQVNKYQPESKDAVDVVTYTINMGPQHPAAHGVLRLVIGLDGEIVKRADSHIGLLHRGTEELMRGKTVEKGLPYMDRLDYVSMMSQEHTYVLAVEKLNQIKVTEDVKYIRMMYLEITRLLNHLLAISCHALDVGAMTGYFFGFEERERLMELYERISGARFHAAYFRVGGVRAKPTEGDLIDIIQVVNDMKATLVEIEGLLTENRIWKQRLIGIGVVEYDKAFSKAFSGVMLRGSGIYWDIRKHEPYEAYDELDFNVIVGKNGDCYDRYIIRMEEMKESISMVEQCARKLMNRGAMMNDVRIAEDKYEKFDMTKLIDHFKFKEQGTVLAQGQEYVGTETPKGELGVCITNHSKYGKSIKIRSAGLHHLMGLEYMCKDHFLADVVTVIGTQDIVFGEIDR